MTDRVYMPSILYVEDDFPSQVIMRVLLGRIMKLPCFFIFEDSRDFLKRLESLETVPDIVLLDVQITPHDGFTLLQMLRSDTRYANAKIIARTASVTMSDVTRLREAKFDGLIGKPIDPGKFKNAIGSIMSGEQIWSVM